jgi:hypothetical protein
MLRHVDGHWEVIDPTSEKNTLSRKGTPKAKESQGLLRGTQDTRCIQFGHIKANLPACPRRIPKSMNIALLYGVTTDTDTVKDMPDKVSKEAAQVNEAIVSHDQTQPRLYLPRQDCIQCRFGGTTVEKT